MSYLKTTAYVWSVYILVITLLLFAVRWEYTVLITIVSLIGYHILVKNGNIVDFGFNLFVILIVGFILLFSAIDHKKLIGATTLHDVTFTDLRGDREDIMMNYTENGIASIKHANSYDAVQSVQNGCIPQILTYEITYKNHSKTNTIREFSCGL